MMMSGEGVSQATGTAVRRLSIRPMVLAAVLLAAAARLPSSYSFTPGSTPFGGRPVSKVCVASTAAAAPASADEGTKTTRMADSGVPPATSESSSSIADGVDIPTNLPSDAGLDYVPLATMLASGQLAEADQVRKISMQCSRGCAVQGGGVDRLKLTAAVVSAHTISSSLPCFDDARPASSPATP
jgi:hypothetical protein